MAPAWEVPDVVKALWSKIVAPRVGLSTRRAFQQQAGDGGARWPVVLVADPRPVALWEYAAIPLARPVVEVIAHAKPFGYDVEGEIGLVSMLMTALDDRPAVRGELQRDQRPARLAKNAPPGSRTGLHCLSGKLVRTTLATRGVGVGGSVRMRPHPVGVGPARA